MNIIAKLREAFETPEFDPSKRMTLETGVQGIAAVAVTATTEELFNFK